MGKLVLIHCAVLFAPPLPLPNLGFEPRFTRIGKLLLIYCAVLFAPLPPSTTLPHSYFNFYDSNKSWCSAFMKFLSLGKFFALALFSKKRLCLSLSQFFFFLSFEMHFQWQKCVTLFNLSLSRKHFTQMPASLHLHSCPTLYLCLSADLPMSVHFDPAFFHFNNFWSR